MELELCVIRPPEGVNVILGQAHFIRTIEDLAEAVTTSVPAGRFGVAFNEASADRLVRVEGNDAALRDLAAAHAQAIGAGHVFVVLLADCYPINVLPRIQACPEVCAIFCASANPLQVIVARSAQGRGVVGVIDGEPPRGRETEDDVTVRRRFLRQIGYKL